jgi:threonyl-tRNA synthetase
MIHRAPFGSMERFVAVLLEHTAGKFPLWLTPDQVVVLPVSEKFSDYAKKVVGYLNNCDIRTLFDDRNEKIGKKIRHELKKNPYCDRGEKKTVREGRPQTGEGVLGSHAPRRVCALYQSEVTRQMEACNSIHENPLKR